MTSPSKVGPAGFVAGPTLRALARDLGDARDEQLATIVAVVDALPWRGSVDDVIAPVRGRLARIRPKRPLTLTRLVCTPLDPVLVHPTAWRRGRIGIPRSALAPLIDRLRTGDPTTVADVESMLTGRSADDAAAIWAAGRRIWPVAARVLRDPAVAPSSLWASATGLGSADHLAISQCCAAVLAHADELNDAAANAVVLGEKPFGLLRTILSETTAHGTLAVATVIAIMMTRMPEPGVVLDAVGDLASGHADPSVRQAAEQAIDFMLDSVADDSFVTADLERATLDVRRVAALFDGLDHPGSAYRPSRRQRVESLRRAVDADCRARHDAELSKRVVEATGRLGPVGATDTADEVEAGLRAIKLFEGAARALGGGEHYDRMQRRATASIAQAQDVPLVERARLTEILLGPEAAIALLNQDKTLAVGLGPPPDTRSDVPSGRPQAR